MPLMLIQDGFRIAGIVIKIKNRPAKILFFVLSRIRLIFIHLRHLKNLLEDLVDMPWSNFWKITTKFCFIFHFSFKKTIERNVHLTP